jgi:hypothetical protein
MNNNFHIKLHKKSLLHEHFHISFSHKVEVQTAWYGIGRPVHFSKSHWYSLSLSFPFCSDIFSPPVLCQSSTILTPQWISLCIRPRLGTLRNVIRASSTHQKRYWHFRFYMPELWHSIHKYFRGTLKLKMMVADSYEMLVSSSKSTYCHSPTDTSCVLSILWTSKRTAYLYVFNETVSDCLAFASYRNFSLFHSERHKEGE